jgi:hypothetical protein
MLNNSFLKKNGFERLTATCLLTPESDYTLFDAAPDAKGIPKVAKQAFTPFTVSISAKVNKKHMYIGEAEGFIIEFWENYGSQEDPINIEKLAVMHENVPIVDFTLAILREDGVLPFQWSTRREWCQNGGCFVLVHRISISDAYRTSGIEPFVLNCLQNIIHHDCCIRIESLFIPVTILLSTTRTKLRKQGFTRLGGSDCGYLARHAQTQGLLRQDALTA